MEDLSPASRRVLDAADSLGLAVTVRIMPDSTRTAIEAATACKCAVDQIVKSLIFRGTSSGKPYLLLVSGKNRVDEAKVAAVLGEALQRPDAAYVREVTGFAIGGVSPLGHARPLATYVDPDLLAFDTVFAAAGTPNTIFAVDPKRLAEAVGAHPLTMG
jgi:prolyl-tRNA editing enzyme YbaK/EbsC (Cys-tRNA(Pro) deacylase)